MSELRSVDRGVTVGVAGQRWRASVSSAGAVTLWGSSQPRLDWYVAADDRWHVPASEAAVRQQRLGGAPVTETRVRIPDGDAVQRVWSVADRGGLTVIEIENDSPLPFAVAFSGLGLVTDRTPSDIPIQGIELPADAITLPVAHHTSIRVAIPHRPVPEGVDRNAAALGSVPSADAVVRGWTVVADRASRLSLPDEGLGVAIVAARCDLVLEGPVDATEDPLGFVLDVGELVRCGEDAAPWLPEIVEPLASIARGSDPLLPAAITAARRVARGAEDRRAQRDLEKLAERVGDHADSVTLGPFSELERGASAGRFIADVERRLIAGGDLLPGGIPSAWFGVNFELHDLPTRAGSTVSIAVRWHGERPAVLWEQHGTPCVLTASAVDPAWSTDETAGEALWTAPPTAARRPLVLTTDPGVGSTRAAPPTSFS